MLARSFRSCASAALAMVALVGCASTTPGGSNDYVRVSRVTPLTPTSRVIDMERIQRSGVQTAWDAVRILMPNYRAMITRGSSPLALTPDGSYLEQPIRLFVDGHRVGELDALRAIPAEDVVAIHLLNATEAGTYFGPGNGAGAIIVQTRLMYRPR